MTRTIFLTAYAVILTAALGFHVAGHVWGRTMTFDGFMRALLRWAPVRWLIVLAWLWLGWHLFVRVDR
jgi:hypothetical protein